MACSPVLRCLAVALAVVAGSPLSAQVLEVKPVEPPAAAPSETRLRDAQAEFEVYRRSHVPTWHGRGSAPSRCDERIGRFCYWYDEDEPPPPPEPRSIRQARTRLIALLDTAARAHPDDRWISGQRVRYLAEDGRYDEAVNAARACTAREWWCSGVQGFALHVARRYAASDSAFALALLLMSPREQCDFRDVSVLLDDELLHRYGGMSCAERSAFERRLWWLARPAFSSRGNDARTEFYSRRMMTYFLDDAPSAYGKVDDDEREMILRYGWPMEWTRESDFNALVPREAPLTGHELMPAHPYMPRARDLDDLAESDSTAWRGRGVASVPARYAPAFATHLIPLEHQAALFQRGDSALVALAWSVARDSAFRAASGDGSPVHAALVLTQGSESDVSMARDDSAGDHGTLLARASWSAMLMSAEVMAPAHRALARARYGVRRTDEPYSRIQVSDLLLFTPYDSMPERLQDVLPHMRSSDRLPEGASVGVYWESYRSISPGEPAPAPAPAPAQAIDVSITVAPESDGGWLRRGLRALRLMRETRPVTVGMQDVTRPGTRFWPRAVVVDLSTLTPGRYLLQLELDAGGGSVVHAERVITVERRG